MTEPLTFTGERFTPECVREIWYEHWHRYAFAARQATGKRVLDAACGEGYGSALLATVANSVLGVDLADAAIAHARNRYGAVANLRFEQGDATRLDALPDAGFDLIVSMETLEHVEAQESLIDGFARLLAPGGILLISSPDKRTYSDIPGFRNEHHVRELYRDELLALLTPRFPAVRLLGQKLMFQSAIWSVDAVPQRLLADTATGNPPAVTPRFAYEPLYFIALCARSEADLPAGTENLASLFGDAEESVYAHYNHEVRKNMQAGALLADMERRLAQAEQRAVAAESALAGAMHPQQPTGSWLRRWLRRWTHS